MNTTTELGFIQDIIANPEDDTPRLIFADWLDDHEQEKRAEFIRVQIELASTELGELPQEHLENIESRYLRTSSAHHQWAKDILDILPVGTYIPDAVIFRRGFVAEVHAPLAVLQQHLPAIVQQHPIEKVSAPHLSPTPAHAQLNYNDLTNHYYWYDETKKSEYMSWSHPFHIPGHVWDTLKNGDKRGPLCYYPTAEAAHEALSVALLTLARR